MSNNKMKSLLKGLRYISQIFDNEKEPEMQIGYPTDVKHVAHIGWDGPSLNSPSWMNEFKSAPAFSSAPLSLGGDAKDEDGCQRWPSEGSSRKGARTPGSPVGSQLQNSSPARDMLPEVPKSSRRRSSTGTSAEPPSREKSDKPKQSRRVSRNGMKDSLDGTKATRSGQKEPSGSDSPSSLPDIPKKTRRKKSKDSSVGGSASKASRSSAKAQASEVDVDEESDSVSKSSTLSRSRDQVEENGSSGVS